MDNCRVWASHSDSNWIPRGRYESEVGSRDSRAWEQKKAEEVIERQEREAEHQKRVVTYSAVQHGSSKGSGERWSPDRGTGMWLG